VSVGAQAAFEAQAEEAYATLRVAAGLSRRQRRKACLR